MPARLENEMKITNSIEDMLKGMPTYVVEWHNNLHAGKKTAATRRDFIRKVHRFLTFIDTDVSKVTCDDITSSRVTQYYISISTKQNADGSLSETSVSYQQNIYTALKNFLGFLEKKGYIESNYIEEIDRPKGDDLERINEHRIKLDKRDFKRVLHKAAMERDPVYRYRDGAILNILMSTGMRETALRIINISDIDFQKQTLVTIDKGSNNGKYQIYPLNDETIKVIKKWLEYRKCFEKYPSDALFLNYQGERISCKGISRIVDKYFTQALGRHVSPHKIRGGVISILYEETGNIEFVRRAIGQSKVETTQRYIKTKDDERAQAIKILSF